MDPIALQAAGSRFVTLSTADSTFEVGEDLHENLTIWLFNIAMENHHF